MKTITDELYNDLLTLTSKRSKHLHKILLEIEDCVEVDVLKKARETKTNNKKEAIRKAIVKIVSETHKKPTKYQIHNETGIAYQTLSKYYDEIVDNIQ